MDVLIRAEIQLTDHIRIVTDLEEMNAAAQLLSGLLLPCDKFGRGRKADQDMVAVAMKAVCAIQAPEQVRSVWQRVTERLRKRLHNAVPIIEPGRDDVLAFLSIPREHRPKIWNINPLDCPNKESKRRTKVWSIFPDDTAITGLAGSQPMKPREEWQQERRRFCSEATMAEIPEPEEVLEIAGGDPSEHGAATIIGTTPAPLWIETELLVRLVASSAIRVHS